MVWPVFAGRAPLWACSRLELMGRKNAWEASEGTCVRLVRLVELGGLLESVMEPPGPPNAPPVLQDPIVEGEPRPRLDGGGRVDGRVCAEVADPGRFGSVDTAVAGLAPAANPSL